MLDELSREFKLNSDSRLISSRVRRFNSSIRVESEDLIQVIELSQNVDMKTQLDDQSKFICMIYIFNDRESKSTHKTCSKTIEIDSSEISFHS